MRSETMSKPAVVFGGPSPEHDISILTGLQACRTLLDMGRDVEAIYWAKSGAWFSVDPALEAADFADGVPRKARPLRFIAEPGAGFMEKKKPLDVSPVVVCCHGAPGEDGTLQGAFDLAGIRYTGPGAAGSALGMDKLAFGAVVEQAGLPSVPRHLLVADMEWDVSPPYIVKPRFGGSSIGIEVVDGMNTALALAASSVHLQDGAVIEPFLEGSRDYNIAVRTFPELQLSAIEAPVRAGSAGAIYSYEQKYLSGGGLEGAARELPAVLPRDTERRIREAAKVVAGLIRLRSVARVDFLVRGEDVWVNEINTIPGSLAAYLWIDPPVSRRDLIADIVAEAQKQPIRRFTTAGSDGTALRSAGTIAAKLG
jgi:D-alanine-D-alanine ligase